MYRVNLIPEEYSGRGFGGRTGLKTAGSMAALTLLLLILTYVYLQSAAAGYRQDAAEYRRNAWKPAMSPADMERLQKERRVYESRIQLTGGIARREFFLSAPGENIFKAVPGGVVLTRLEIKKSGVEGSGSGSKNGGDFYKAESDENLVITGEAYSLEALGEYIAAIQELNIFKRLIIREASWERERYKFILSAAFNNGVATDARESGNND
ncbi:hypothetical protein DCCM_4519 [Desulfocucumis palustris]|uniref:Uncharacterized protein n=2 Tax=Desulfocucumis palustris TaxID=1898651 RepID=A0A2L2XM48_9FIRM|nr:hypothetical protein DCCM_4519 [Desulfocucumis palustris]